MEKYDYCVARYGKIVADKLNVSVTMNGKPVHVLSLSSELQADYLINNDFNFFRSKDKLFLLERCA